MAIPVIPILKKIAISLVSDKKGRRRLLGIVLGVLFILLLPIITLLAVFSSGIGLDTDKLLNDFYAQQTKMEAVSAEIETQMRNAGYTQIQVEKAQTLYVFALCDEGEQEGFVLRLVGCFKAEQSDEELVLAVNTEFGKDIRTEDFISAVQELGGTHVLSESKKKEKRKVKTSEKSTVWY